MSEAKNFYVCAICGNQVEMLEDGGGELICCGEPMMLKKKSCETAQSPEHDLKISKIPGGIRVQVGQNGHPMKPEHYIQWIECWVKDHVFRKHLKPKDEPTAEFMVDNVLEEGEKPIIRMFCNIHGMRYCNDCENGCKVLCASAEECAA